MASPVGEDNWVSYVDHQLHAAVDLERRVNVIESFRKAVAAEPGSLKVWMAYCEYFWSLYADCQLGSDAGWPAEEQLIGRETFTLDAALSLWQEGYEAVKYRLSDSHELWNRWVSLEMELLARSVTEPGIRRITHLFRDRLAVPHATWDNTSQMFSTFLSQHNPGAYEYEMQETTKRAQEAKRLYRGREPFEERLSAAIKSGDFAQIKTAMGDYLDWEIRGVKQLKRDTLTNLRICLGLFSRALTGPLGSDADTWQNYLVLISTLHSDIKAKRTKITTNDIPRMLDVHQRAVHHVPWCGSIWARYILAAEEAGLSFTDIERIKHGATDSGHLDRDTMEPVLEMYSAWCGYLKRTAMNPSATEEAVDLAEVGLPSALEDVKHWGKRKYGDGYLGDPTYRLEKILIQFLTEKKEDIEQARGIWEQLSTIDIYAKSYDFWLNWFLWEMVVFGSAKNKTRSPTPHTLAQGLRTPSFATRVFTKALQVKDMDWPERVMELYLKHCNDYELVETLREAEDAVYKARKGLAKRREREKRQAEQHLAEQQAAYAAQIEDTARSSHDEVMADCPPAQTDANGKRKRGSSLDRGGKGDELANKRPKNESAIAAQQKRDRENTSVFVSNLPDDVTITKIKQFFRGYGHVNNVVLSKEPGTPPVAHVELSSPEDVESALLRDGKRFDKDAEEAVHVYPATDCTLYVTNYPPEFTEKDIRDLFKDCGEIHSVRFPSLIANTRRRFCYVTFRDRAFAEAATKLDGKHLGGEFKLLAKYSDPPVRGGRAGPQAEGRELHVVHLPWSATEDEIKQMFEKAGTVVTVRLIRNKAGRSVGSAFVVMETKEQAQEAIKILDRAVMGKRVLKVELSKPITMAKVAATHGPANVANGDSPGSAGSLTVTGSPAPEPSAQSEHPFAVRRREVVILNVPDTMNVDQLRRLLTPIEPITTLTLHPKHGGAIAELKDAAAAGRAALVVEGLEIDGSGGRKLRVGAHHELFQQEPETRIDRVDQPSTTKSAAPADKKKTAAELMPPPPPVNRPSLKPVTVSRPTLGRGGKRGLPIATPIHKKTPASATTNGTVVTNGTADGPGSGKSNADFKKLFLSGGKDTDESKPEVKQE